MTTHSSYDIHRLLNPFLTLPLLDTAPSLPLLYTTRALSPTPPHHTLFPSPRRPPRLWNCWHQLPQSSQREHPDSSILRDLQERCKAVLRDRGSTHNVHRCRLHGTILHYATVCLGVGVLSVLMFIFVSGKVHQYLSSPVCPFSSYMIFPFFSKSSHSTPYYTTLHYTTSLYLITLPLPGLLCDHSRLHPGEHEGVVYSVRQEHRRQGLWWHYSGVPRRVLPEENRWSAVQWCAVQCSEAASSFLLTPLILYRSPSFSPSLPLSLFIFTCYSLVYFS